MIKKKRYLWPAKKELTGAAWKPVAAGGKKPPDSGSDCGGRPRRGGKGGAGSRGSRIGVDQKGVARPRGARKEICVDREKKISRARLERGDGRKGVPVEGERHILSAKREACGETPGKTLARSRGGARSPPEDPQRQPPSKCCRERRPFRWPPHQEREEGEDRGQGYGGRPLLRLENIEGQGIPIRD